MGNQYGYYICRLTSKLEYPNVIDVRGGYVSPSPVDGMCSIDIDNNISLFKIIEEDGVKKIYPTGFKVGWENFPTMRIDGETGKIVSFDPHESAALAAWWRRERVIQPDAQDLVKPGTELKKMRKAILAIIEAVEATNPGLSIRSHPDVEAFLDYSNHIQSVIDRHPKGEDVDLREINGTKEQG